MPCAGCLRRRKKIAAAIVAVKVGFARGKQAYKVQTGQQPPARPTPRKREPIGGQVIDIRK